VSLSETQERTIGNRIMREVRIDPQFVQDPDVTDYVTSLGERLLGVADTGKRELTFFVIQDDVVNAFALIGGHIGMKLGADPAHAERIRARGRDGARDLAYSPTPPGAHDPRPARARSGPRSRRSR
jgi:hypothetical protein